jgi:hypothetical protein
MGIGFAIAPVQAKKAWNGPDLHGINPEAAPTVIHSSPEAKTKELISIDDIPPWHHQQSPFSSSFKGFFSSAYSVTAWHLAGHGSWIRQ